jgi:hypothetical protein
MREATTGHRNDASACASVRLFICAWTQSSRHFVSPRRCKEKAGPAEYLVLALVLVAHRLAEGMGRTVVADSVNPLNITRNAWLLVAADASKDAIEIEIICSDPSEHRSRVETGNADIDGLSWPPGPL